MWEIITPTLVLPPQGGGEKKNFNPFPQGGGEKKNFNPFLQGGGDNENCKSSLLKGEEIIRMDSRLLGNDIKGSGK